MQNWAHSSQSASITLYSICIVASGEVYNLYSSLDTTDRHHACAGELVTFVCETSGTMLIWTVNQNRIVFFSDDRVDTVRVTLRQSIRAMLLQNDPYIERERERRFTSALLVIVDSGINFINITCSSNTINNMRTRVHGIGGACSIL